MNKFFVCGSFFLFDLIEIYNKKSDQNGLYFEEMILKRGYLITSLAVTSDGENKETSLKKIEKAKATVGLDPQIGIITINMNVVGLDYVGMKNLLSLIESNLRIMDIETIAYSYTGETLNLVIKTYYLK